MLANDSNEGKKQSDFFLGHSPASGCGRAHGRVSVVRCNHVVRARARVATGTPCPAASATGQCALTKTTWAVSASV